MARDGSGDVGLAIAVWRRGGKGGFVAVVMVAKMLIRLFAEQLGRWTFERVSRTTRLRDLDGGGDNEHDEAHFSRRRIQT